MCFPVYKGAEAGKMAQFDVSNSGVKLQVVVFYPSDWNSSSLALLSSFSCLADQFKACQAALYGCSTDSLGSHLSWTAEQFTPAFPLLSDPSGQFSDRFRLYDEESRQCLAGVVMLDSAGRELEVIHSSLASDDLAAYCLDLAWKTAANEDFKACNLSDYVQRIDKQLRIARAVPSQIFRETSRSRFLKRNDGSKARSKSCDPSRVKELKRTEDRLSRGFF